MTAHWTFLARSRWNQAVRMGNFQRGDYANLTAIST